jgi:YVTN family beta-propeller protein
VKDLDRVLESSLKAVGESFRPSDVTEAQGEFLRRRRRRRVGQGIGALAFAGAAVAVAVAVVQPGPGFETESDLPVASEAMVAATVDVGEMPDGLRVAEDGVWVANSDDGTVSRIDPATNDVVTEIPVGGQPEEVAIGEESIWVTDREGALIARIDESSDDVSQIDLETRVGADLDLTVGRGAVWVAGGNFETVTSAGTRIVSVTQDRSEVNELTDVAVDAAEVWALSEHEGYLTRIDPSTGLPTGEPIELPTSDNGDLDIGAGYIWVAVGDAGEVVRVDPPSGEVSDPVQVGGSYAAIAIDDDWVWVLSGGHDESPELGLLYRIDPESVEIVGDPLELTGQPFDVAARDGAVWVTNRADGTVTRIDVPSEPTPSLQT